MNKLSPGSELVIFWISMNALNAQNGDQAIDYTFGQPDFNFIQFRSNLVLRWEYTPGSELFLVWSQGATAYDDPQQGIFRSLSDNLFGENARNIFLVKGTYRFMR